jgi:hypothetical protein
MQGLKDQGLGGKVSKCVPSADTLCVTVSKSVILSPDAWSLSPCSFIPALRIPYPNLPPQPIQ